MSTITVLHTVRPRKGKSIPNGSYEYLKSPGGQPALRIRWKGKLFSDDPILFVFGTQCEGICLVKADVIKALATNHQTRLALNTLKPMGVGLIANLALDAVSAIRHPTKGNAGFIVGYKNADNETGLFFAIASSEIVDEIVASIPPEKVTPDNA